MSFVKYEYIVMACIIYIIYRIPYMQRCCVDATENLEEHSFFISKNEAIIMLPQKLPYLLAWTF